MSALNLIIYKLLLVDCKVVFRKNLMTFFNLDKRNDKDKLRCYMEFIELIKAIRKKSGFKP